MVQSPGRDGQAYDFCEACKARRDVFGAGLEAFGYMEQRHRPRPPYGALPES
jgi:hypothetical protein